MNGSNGGDESAGVDGDRRLSSLDQRLDALEANEAARTGRDRPRADPNTRMGNRVIADLIGGIAGGMLVGWLIDRVFDTAPWGFLIFLFLGIVVAFRNVFRLANGAALNPSDPGKDSQG